MPILLQCVHFAQCWQQGVKWAVCLCVGVLRLCEVQWHTAHGMHEASTTETCMVTICPELIYTLANTHAHSCFESTGTLELSVLLHLGQLQAFLFCRAAHVLRMGRNPGSAKFSCFA